MQGSLPIAAKIYLTVIAGVAAGLIGISAMTVQIDLSREMLLAAILLGLVSLTLEYVEFPLAISGNISFATVAHVATVFMLPFPVPAIIGLVTVVIADLRRRQAFSVRVYNASNHALTLGSGSLIWRLTWGKHPIDELPFTPSVLLSALLVVITIYVVNVILTDGIISIASGRSVRYVWLTNDMSMLLPYVSLEVVGILVAVVWQTAPAFTPLLIVPAVTTYLAFEMIHRLRQQTQEAMIAMADAIDQRDPYTADHSRRVSELAVRVAEEYGMNERDIERLRLASRMHDIGKIGIGNDLLHKPGKLNEEEWKSLQEHPVIGEQLLKPYRQFHHETRLVRSHHERWDGRGYPDKLRGQAIPLGARMIAVADTFDAMTTSRPYRPALSRQTAIDEIRNGALTQFDPRVVAAFLQVMDESSKIRSIIQDLPVSEEEGRSMAWSSSSPS